jgi:hypothetical protein
VARAKKEGSGRFRHGRRWGRMSVHLPDDLTEWAYFGTKVMTSRGGAAEQVIDLFYLQVA